jgi:hypothetical protein
MPQATKRYLVVMEELRERARAGDSDRAFAAYRRFLDSKGVSPNGIMLSVLAEALAYQVQRCDTKRLAKVERAEETHAYREHTSLIEARLVKIEGHAIKYGVMLPPVAYCALLRLESLLYEHKRGSSSSPPSESGGAGVLLTNAEAANIDSMVDAVKRLRYFVEQQHKDQGTPLQRDEAIWTGIMYVAHAQERGLGVVLRCYETMVEADVPVPSARANNALLSMALANVRKATGSHELRVAKAVRAKLPAELVDSVARVIELFTTMGDVDARTFDMALSLTYALDDLDAASRLAAAFEQHQHAIDVDTDLINSLIRVCSRMRPLSRAKNFVAQLWDMLGTDVGGAGKRRHSRRRPDATTLNVTIGFYGREGYVAESIALYERAIAQFGIEPDERTVAALLYAVAHWNAKAPEHTRALELAYKSPFAETEVVQHRINKLPPAAISNYALLDQSSRRQRRRRHRDIASTDRVILSSTADSQ